MGRYVDSLGKPLDTELAPDSRFNLLPVRLVVVMDPRSIPDFLAYCADPYLHVETKQFGNSLVLGMRAADSYMRVEVKQLRIDGVEQDIPNEPSDIDTEKSEPRTVEILGVVQFSAS